MPWLAARARKRLSFGNQGGNQLIGIGGRRIANG